MGNCTSSKRIEASVATGAYRPALDFDINNIEEPWRTADQDQHEDDEDEDEDEEKDNEMKKVASSPVALDKLNRSLEADQEAPPPTWEQVKKDLEFIKPTLQPPIPKPTALMPPKPASPVAPVPMKKIKRKSFSFHTLEELDTKRPSSITKPDSDASTGFRKIESMNNLSDFSSVKAGLRKTNSVKQGADSTQQAAGVELEGFKPVRQNIFLLKDRMERQKEGKEPGFLRRDPLSDYQELCPPGGADLVVVYTTSLGGVRRTYEDCYKVRSILELHRVVFDERDVSLHGEFLSELKELVGEGAAVPRLFVKGRYIGGVDEVVHLNETGKLRRIWNWVGVERGSGRQGCEGCGGARFVPCLDCGGSCKVVVLVEGKTQKQKCPECNENGLIHCPACL